VDPIIVGEFSYRQPFVPIVLALIYKESQELLNFLIDPLCLTISLRVVSSGHCDPDFQQLAETAHEIQHELGPSVTNDLLREPMEFPNMVSEQLSYARGGNIRGGWYGVSMFGQAIYDDHNGVVSVALR